MPSAPREFIPPFIPVTGMKCSYGKISSPLTEISVGKTEISGTEPARSFIWTYRKFYKGFRGKARARKPIQPGQPGSYEDSWLPITCLLLGKSSKSWESSSYRQFKANNRKKETNEMGRRRSSSIMHTTLQGQEEICRYLERGIKQQSLINTVYRAGQKKKTNRKRQRQRAHGWLEINTHTICFELSTVIDAR